MSKCLQALFEELHSVIISASCCALMVWFWISFGAPKNPGIYLAYGAYFEASKWVIHGICAYYMYVQARRLFILGCWAFSEYPEQCPAGGCIHRRA